MARYIKANPKVAQYLQLQDVRNRVTDGNYLLWQADMLAFGKLIDLPEILTQIGAISLVAKEAKEEQDGTVVRELPTATDPRFIIETAEPADDEVEYEAEGTEEAVVEEPAEDETESGDTEVIEQEEEKES
jgi:hypothetical protein